MPHNIAKISIVNADTDNPTIVITRDNNIKSLAATSSTKDTIVGLWRDHLKQVGYTVFVSKDSRKLAVYI